MTVQSPPARPQLYEHEHELYRESLRAFLKAEVVPHVDAWDRDGIVPRELYLKAGAHGFLGSGVPEEYGGPGADDFRFSAILAEETAYLGVVGATLGIVLQNTVCLPYFLSLCTDEQKARWLPGIASGELVTAIAMTEPDAGSDLAAMKATAERDGDDYVVNGSKTFITNGIHADLVIVAAKTRPEGGHRGLSLLVVERDTDGFERGRNLEKLGQHAQDTAELFFTDARIPADNLLGTENAGFLHLVSNLAEERMSIAVGALAAAEAAVGWTVDYVRERHVFGRPLGAMQTTRFALAECQTEIRVTRAFVEDCLVRLLNEELSPEDAAMAKYWASDVQGRVVDRCLQLHGGYGYMLEYPIARAFADGRITRIFGGANEVMKDLVGRSMELS